MDAVTSLPAGPAGLANDNTRTAGGTRDLERDGVNNGEMRNLSRDTVFAVLSANFSAALTAQGPTPQTPLADGQPQGAARGARAAGESAQGRNTARNGAIDGPDGAANAAPTDAPARGAPITPGPADGASPASPAVQPAANARSEAALAAPPINLLAASLSRPGTGPDARAGAIAPGGDLRASLSTPSSTPARTPGAQTAQTAQTALPDAASFETAVHRQLTLRGSQFQIRLDPPSLGRIDGVFDIADDGTSSLRLTFDNPDTFNQFSDDEAALRLLLADAGFDPGEQGLDLQLASDQSHTPAPDDARNRAPATRLDGIAIGDPYPARAIVDHAALDIVA